MMRFMQLPRLALAMGLLAFGAGLAPDRAWAENDYEFGLSLMSKDKEGNFKADDLVEKLIDKLLKAPDVNSQLEGKLLKAQYLREGSTSASPEKREQMLTEANNLYTEFENAGKNHRLAEEAAKQKATIKETYAKALIKAAKDAEDGGNAAEGAKLRGEAVKILKAIADVKEEDAKKLHPPLLEALKAIGKYFEQNPEAERAPGNVIAPAQNALIAYIPMDKMAVISRMEQVEAYPAGDAERATVGKTLTEYCQKQVDWCEENQLEDLSMWYNFIRGRVHSIMLEDDKATEAWSAALNIDISRFSPEVKETVKHIKKLIVADFIAMKMKAGEKNPAKYAEIKEVIGNIKWDANMKGIFDEDIGKKILLDYAEALIRIPNGGARNYQDAFKELRTVVEKGEVPGADLNAKGWGNSASLKMAEVMDSFRKTSKSTKPSLDAPTWRDCARGYYMRARLEYKKYTEYDEARQDDKAKAAFKDAYALFDRAVDCYREAITQARNPDATPVAERLKVEPQAWLEMGNSYHYMKNNLEAVIAFRALLNNFSEEARAKWLPDPKTAGNFYNNPAIKGALKELDAKSADWREDGTLSKATKNVANSLTKATRSSNPKFKVTRWQRNLEVEVKNEMAGGEAEPSAFSDTAYQAARLAMEEAKDLESQGLQELKGKKDDEAKRLLGEAITKYSEAGGKFAEIKPSSKAYETGLYMSGSAYAAAQALYGDSRLGSLIPPEEATAKGKELGEKALGAFKVYEEHVTKEAVQTEEDKAMRLRLGLNIKFNKCLIEYAFEHWEKVLEVCDDYTKYETTFQGTEKNRVSVAFYKFRALIHLASANKPPECDKYIEMADGMLDQLKDKDTYYRWAVTALTARLQDAALQAEAAKLPKEDVLKYKTKVANMQERNLELKDEADRTLNDYGTLLYYYKETKKTQKAADTAIMMLQRFDPKNRNKVIGADVSDEDEKLIWMAMYEEMHKLIVIKDDFNKLKQCRQDHLDLLDRIYDTREGIANEGNPNLRPKNDKLNKDFAKAQELIKHIKDVYPDCPTHNPNPKVSGQTYKDTGKSYIQVIEEEIDFRRRIVAVRDLLSGIALDVARAKDKEGDKEGAKYYRTIADEQLRILELEWGNIPEIKVTRAKINIANEEYDKALDILNIIKRDEHDNSSKLYIDASKMISEVYKLQGKWQDAAKYPLFMASTAGLKSKWVDMNWPDMEEFLEECYKNGVPRFVDPKTSVDTTGIKSYTPKTMDEKLLEEMEPAYQLALKKPELMTSELKFRHQFLTDKIANYKEFQSLERTQLRMKDSPDAAKVMTEDFKKRYEILRKLRDKETEAWMLILNYDDQIVKTANNVPKEVGEKRDNAVKAVDELKAELAKVPKVTLPD